MRTERCLYVSSVGASLASAGNGLSGMERLLRRCGSRRGRGLLFSSWTLAALLLQKLYYLNIDGPCGGIAPGRFATN